jgi:hypothetical protein
MARDTSFLAVEVELGWEMNNFLQKAEEIAQKCGFAPWKAQELAESLQGIFYRRMRDGENFGAIAQEIDNLVAVVCEKNPKK